MQKEGKPGLLTTEFWLTVAFHVSAVGMMALGQIEAQWAVSAMAVAQAVYSYTRGRVKSDEALAAAAKPRTRKA